MSVFSVTLPSPSPRPLLQFYKSSTEYIGVSLCHGLMETSVLDASAIPCGNLTALCFPNQLAKKKKKKYLKFKKGKTLFPMQIYAPLTLIFFSDPRRKVTFPNRNWTLLPFNAREVYYWECRESRFKEVSPWREMKILLFRSIFLGHLLLIAGMQHPNRQNQSKIFQFKPIFSALQGVGKIDQFVPNQKKSGNVCCSQQYQKH